MIYLYLFVIVFFCFFLVFVIHEYWKVYIRSISWMSKGRYDEVIAYWKTRLVKLDSKRSLGFKNTNRNAWKYNIAVALNRKGDFEESLRWLDQVEESKLDKNLAEVYYGLYANNLLLGERDFPAAEDCLDKAGRYGNMRIWLLTRSYLELLKGNLDKAAEYVEDFYKQAEQRQIRSGFPTFLIFDKQFEKILIDFYLGFYSMKRGESESAREHLQAASQCEYKNYYSEKAKELLENLK